MERVWNLVALNYLCSTSKEVAVAKSLVIISKTCTVISINM